MRLTFWFMFFSIRSPIWPLKRSFLFSCRRKAILKKGVFLFPKSLCLCLLDNHPKSSSVQKNHSRHVISAAETAHSNHVSGWAETRRNAWHRSGWLTVSARITPKWTAEATGDTTFDVTGCPSWNKLSYLPNLSYMLMAIVYSSSGKLQAKFFKGIV